MTKKSGLQNRKLIIPPPVRKFVISNSKQNRMLIKVGKSLMELIVSVIVIDWVENVIGVEPTVSVAIKVKKISMAIVQQICRTLF